QRPVARGARSGERQRAARSLEAESAGSGAAERVTEPIEDEMATPTTVKDVKPSKEIVNTVRLPAPNGDFYEVTEILNAGELKLLKEVRAFMETNVAPIITKYWADDAFPFEVL